MDWTYLVRAGRIQNVQRQVDPADGEVTVVHLFDGAFVLRRKGAIQELGDDGTLADLGRPHDDDLVPYVGNDCVFVVFQGSAKQI